jgi:hypothetical protein
VLATATAPRMLRSVTAKRGYHDQGRDRSQDVALAARALCRLCIRQLPLKRPSSLTEKFQSATWRRSVTRPDATGDRLYREIADTRARHRCWYQTVLGMIPRRVVIDWIAVMATFWTSFKSVVLSCRVSIPALEPSPLPLVRKLDSSRSPFPGIASQHSSISACKIRRPQRDGGAATSQLRSPFPGIRPYLSNGAFTSRCIYFEQPANDAPAGAASSYRFLMTFHRFAA